MRYHFVINGYSADVKKQMQEMNWFRQMYLSGMEQGEGIIYSGSQKLVMENDTWLPENFVLLIGQTNYSPEIILNLLEKQMREEDIYIFGSDYSGTELAVRSAARKNGSSVTAVHNLDTQKRVIVKKMVYSNHMQGSFFMKKGPYCFSLAKGIDKLEFTNHKAQVIETIISDQKEMHVKHRKIVVKEKKEDIEKAPLVIAAGRGAKNAKEVEKFLEVSRQLGGCLGISRPAAMNAWAPMEKLIGVSGAMISPEICITAGVSGAAAFYAGIEKSKFIVAINTDEKAPIMKQADIVIVDDCRPVIDALSKLVGEERGTEGAAVNSQYE